MRVAYEFLYKDYKEDYYLWELVKFIYKFLIALVSNSLTIYPEKQIPITIMLLLSYFVMEFIYKPYKS
jgi:hypothetical protein